MATKFKLYYINKLNEEQIKAEKSEPKKVKKCQQNARYLVTNLFVGYNPPKLAKYPI